MDIGQAPPNHHAHHPPFTGVRGYLAALSMVAGRTDDADLAIGLAEMGRGDVVVDIGGGPGAAARRAASRGAGAVVGVDPSRPMLRVARLLTRARAVRYVEGRAESLPLPDHSATVVWSLATVHHWGDVDRALGEVHRVLRPGGRFLVSERERSEDATGLASHGWTAAQAAAFAAACRAHGFDGVRDERHGARRTVVARR
jgi:ubiquinone/menaquinone biosynthesis C-methylase UbiE